MPSSWPIQELLSTNGDLPFCPNQLFNLGKPSHIFRLVGGLTLVNVSPTPHQIAQRCKVVLSLAATYFTN